MANSDLETRVANLETELANLKLMIERPQKLSEPWWERVAGTFADDPAFEEATRLGRKWRESFRPKAERRKK